MSWVIGPELGHRSPDMRKPVSLASLAHGHFVKNCGQFDIKQLIIWCSDIIMATICGYACGCYYFLVMSCPNLPNLLILIFYIHIGKIIAAYGGFF